MSNSRWMRFWESPGFDEVGLSTKSLIRGVTLVAASVLLSLATLGLWLGNLENNPLFSWAVFVLGFALSAAAAITGVWSIMGFFRDKEGK